MAHRVMAARALQAGRLAVNYIAVDRRCDRFVTAAAGIFCDLVIELGDLDGVGISAAGEIEGMPESVVRLHRVFPDDVVRGVTVVAGGNRMMAALHPGVILRLHHVTVGACRWIVGEIRISFGINERVSGKANCNAYDDGRQDGDGA